MPQFQLVFSDRHGERSEVRDKTDGELRVDGKLLIDGATIFVRGIDWLVTREDLDDGLIRFVCTPVVPSS